MNYNDNHLYLLEKKEINCLDLVQIMGEYHDDELPDTLNEKVSDHIRKCEQCEKFALSYSMVVEIAGELKDREVPRDVRNRLREGLNKKLGIGLAKV